MKKRILMISPVPSHPQTAGNRARIYRLGQAIKALGHDFFFAHIERETGDQNSMAECWGPDFFFPIAYTRPNPLSFRIKRKLKSFFDKEAYFKYDLDVWYDLTVDPHLKRLYGMFEFDIVFVEYIFLSRALRCFPDSVLKVIDTHDVLTNRHKQFVERGKSYNWYSTTAAQEKKGLNRADVIVAIQESERAFFSEMTKKKIITIGHMVDTKKQDEGKSSTFNILFIGSANQSNIDAIKFFIGDIFPRIKQGVPNATLFVAGKVCRILNGNTADILTLGEVADLESVYDKADVVVNPIRMGTGLKIKNIEAMGYSKPLVTTAIGAVGLEIGIDSAFSVADTAPEFSDAVIRILNDTELHNRLSGSGYTLAVDWNRKQMEALQGVINGAITF